MDGNDNVVGHDNKYNCEFSAGLELSTFAFWFLETSVWIDHEGVEVIEACDNGLVFLLMVLMVCCDDRCLGHLMEKIEKENLLHRAFSVFLFNSKHELLLQVWVQFCLCCTIHPSSYGH